MTTDGFWAVVELMGHVKMAGFVTEEERFGAKLGRIDIPQGDEGQDPFTQYFGGSSVYRITPTTEELARQMAVAWRPRPISVYDLKTVPQLSGVNHVMFDDDEKQFDDDEY
jgi:hypothetical protein